MIAAFELPLNDGRCIIMGSARNGRNGWMVARLISLVLMVAIVACPMWCGERLCPAAPCCSATPCPRIVCAVHETADCCCEPSSPNKSDPNPSRPANQSSCQGICGGAVFEQLSQVDNFDGSIILPLFDVHASTVSRRSSFRRCDVPTISHCGGNRGRSLRTLYMSFLC